MWILDFTSLLGPSKTNYYVFNPSILEITLSGKTYYLIAYRIISYDIPMEYHPWSIWDTAYKFFNDPEKVRTAKYRNKLGPKITHPWQSVPINQTTSEYDSTGLVLATFDNGFHVAYNIAHLFPGEMNQDARLVECDGKITIIYNVFEDKGITLRCRDLVIGPETLQMSQERYLFNHIYRPAEKHCCYGVSRNIIQYGIGDYYEQIINGVLTRKKMRAFDYLSARYGKSNVLVSLSTPLVAYKDRHIACGHVKIMYKKFAFDFLSAIDMERIHKHGQYIYFMYIYEVVNGTVTRCSPIFIPTVGNNHLPYLLVMAIGMTKLGSKYCISYGEGDCKSKCLVLCEQEVDRLLSDEMAEQPPSFLTEQMNVMHVGYWNEMNCGDDAFMDVFKHLYIGTPHKPTFGKTFDKVSSHVNVLGGGDVINDFFVKDDTPRNSIAVSVGIPYQEFIPKLDLFKAVYLRNENDARIHNKLYIPDLTFLLPVVYGAQPRPATVRNNKKLGIILIRTYYKPDYIDIYDRFCKEMIAFINLAHKDGFVIHLIPFCIASQKVKENDNLIIQDICKGLKFKPKVFTASGDYVRKTYDYISMMDFCICSRFHSHVFSTIHAVPFISLTCGRKCIEYMRQMPDCLYQLKANEVDLPTSFNGSHFYRFFKTKWAERASIVVRLDTLRNTLFGLIAKFATDYISLLRKFSVGATMVLWRPEGICCGSSPAWRPRGALVGKVSRAAPKKKGLDLKRPGTFTKPQPSQSPTMVFESESSIDYKNTIIASLMQGATVILPRTNNTFDNTAPKNGKPRNINLPIQSAPEQIIIPSSTQNYASPAPVNYVKPQKIVRQVSQQPVYTTPVHYVNDSQYANPQHTEQSRYVSGPRYVEQPQHVIQQPIYVERPVHVAPQIIQRTPAVVYVEQPTQPVRAVPKVTQQMRYIQAPEYIESPAYEIMPEVNHRPTYTMVRPAYQPVEQRALPVYQPTYQPTCEITQQPTYQPTYEMTHQPVEYVITEPSAVRTITPEPVVENIPVETTHFPTSHRPRDITANPDVPSQPMPFNTTSTMYFTEELSISTKNKLGVTSPPC